MILSEIPEITEAKNQLQELIKPFQQEQNRRQRQSDFMKKCILCVEKNDFFQLDELLRSKLAEDILEDPNFQGCDSIFASLQAFADKQVANYRLEYKSGLLQMAEEMELPIKIDLPRFSVLKGIDGEIDFANRTTKINQTTIKSIDPRRVALTALHMKHKLYDSNFDPQKFIDTLLECYKEILKEAGEGSNEIVPIRQLYTAYVWSLQSKTFFQNMDKGKFKGYSIEQFAVDLWRFFESDVTATEGGYRIKLNSGRGKSLWLIDHDGEKRLITNASFIKMPSKEE